MKRLVSNLFSFILPVTVLILVPYWLTGFTLLKIGFWIYPGIILTTVGLSVLGITVASFILKGDGTLAPWSPTHKLVISGLHAYVRNPMIMGVATALTGETMIFWSQEMLVWTIIFIIINHCFFLFFEEPSMLKRFGKEYEDYKKHVRRWIPGLHPYIPEKEN